MNMQQEQIIGITIKTIPMVVSGILLISEPATAKQLEKPIPISNKVLQLALLPNFSENWNPSQIKFPHLSQEQITTKPEFIIASNHKINNLDGEKLKLNALPLNSSPLIALESTSPNQDSIPIPVSQPPNDDRNVSNPVLIPVSVDATNHSPDNQPNPIPIAVTPPPTQSYPNLPPPKTQPDRILTNFSQQVHRVQPGETLNSIALTYGITQEQLIKANHLNDPNLIEVNQALMIPGATPDIPDKPTLIAVKAEEASDLGTDFSEFQEQEANQAIRAGNSAANPYNSSASSEPQIVSAIPIDVEYYNPLIQPSPGEMVSPDLPQLHSPDQYLPDSNRSFNGYIWPTKGVITSGYGWRWGRMHKGIDIAGPIGTPIVAAAGGEVVTAGWNSGGYGNLVKLKHYDGSITVYAHNSKILVRRGQTVNQGQQIAAMGSTGYSTGPHLHFEIHPQGDRAANPIAFLPKK
jgi:murein DD-endopeptidase MepM/ murein hydrolase activator NlpD